MTRFYYIFLLKFFSITLLSQIPKANFHSNEHNYYDFTGKVKTCKIRNYDDQNQYHWSIINNKNQNLYYDENGNLTDRITYNISGFLYSDSIYAETKWTYNYENNTLMQVNETDIESNEIVHFWIYRYEGDSLTQKKLSK